MFMYGPGAVVCLFSLCQMSPQLSTVVVSLSRIFFDVGGFFSVRSHAPTCSLCVGTCNVNPFLPLILSTFLLACATFLMTRLLRSKRYITTQSIFFPRKVTFRLSSPPSHAQSVRLTATVVRSAPLSGPRDPPAKF